MTRRASRWPRAAARLRAVLSEDAPLARVLAIYGTIQFVASWWDLPGSYSWENDGVAPRDLFVGLAENLTPGKGHTYPLMHFALLGVLCLPILLTALARARSFAFVDLRSAMLAVPTMTAISVVAKLVSVVMGCVALWALARIVRRTVSASAGRWAVAFAATCLSVSYYGRTVNLDGPCLMWTALAMDALLASAESGRQHDYWRAALFTAAAVATKDQAYASFVLTLPLYGLLLPLYFRRAPGSAHSLYPDWSWRRLLGSTGVFALGLGALGGGLWNPTGFLFRLRLLTGPNTESWRLYAPTLAGKLENLGAIARSQADAWWPWPAVALAWLGVGLACAMPREGALGRTSFRLLPLVAGLSSLVFFSLVVGRTEHRFLLPLGFWLSAYGGIAADWAVRRARAPVVIRVAVGAMVLASGLRGLGLVATQWGDARREVTDYLARLPSGSQVETYGGVTYQPHYAAPPRAPYRVRRVGPEPVRRRDPLVPGEEVVATFGEALTPPADVLVITEGFAGRFFQLARPGVAAEARRYFTAALAGQLPGYELVRTFEPRVPAWLRMLGMAPIEIHGSTGQRAWVLRRRP
jgi:hypothetical protein